MKSKNYARRVYLAAWLALGIAAIDAVIFQIGLANGWPFNQAAAGEIIVLATLGIIAAALARCLKSIEARLSKLETGSADQA
jgi:hypothetical protein